MLHNSGRFLEGGKQIDERAEGRVINKPRDKWINEKADKRTD